MVIFIFLSDNLNIKIYGVFALLWLTVFVDLTVLNYNIKIILHFIQFKNLINI